MQEDNIHLLQDRAENGREDKGMLVNSSNSTKIYKSDKK